MTPLKPRVPFAFVALTLALAAPFCAQGQPVAQVTVSPGSTRCEQPLTLTVTLEAPAQSAGVVVRLTSSSATVATLPAMLSIVGGDSAGVVQFRCKPLRESVTVTFSALSSGATRSALLAVQPALTNVTTRSITDGTSNTVSVGETPPAAPPTLTLLNALPTTSTCDQPIEFRVALTSAAPAGGVVVSLASSSPASLQMPPTVTVLAGKTTEFVRVRCIPIQQPLAVTIRASVAGSSKTTSVRLFPLTSTSPKDATSSNIIAGLTTTPVAPAPTVVPALTSLVLTSLEVPGGLGVTARVAATSGTTGVTVSVVTDRSQAVTLPATVVFAAGEVMKSIVIDTRPQLEPLVVEVSAADSRTPTLRTSVKFVIRPPRVSSIVLASTTLAAGGSVVGRLTLDGPAPDGFTVHFTSNSAAVPPALIAVKAGATVVSFTLPTKAQPTGAVVTLTAIARGDTVTGGIATTVKIAP